MKYPEYISVRVPKGTKAKLKKMTKERNKGLKGRKLTTSDIKRELMLSGL